jgi:hypothetical protein
MTGDFERLVSVPPYTRNLASKDQLKWSAEFEVPAIGEPIVIRLNGIGRAKVLGHATLHGYLGVMAVPFDPPAWWIRQNGPCIDANASLVFGAEIAPASTAQQASTCRSRSQADDTPQFPPEPRRPSDHERSRCASG